ncbi:DedA family protein [Rhodoferax sp. UBA5149]|uniref:DedA family protein n=1 Tax=Rhodoferax sp. UBA5149 TaxID=1947379 RepID=UPI0025FE57D7|nr:DedA family protein [Rhodoferax sp. UBA5149]
MFDWLRSQLPYMPHYGYALVFIVVFLNNIGFPLPGETILLGAGFILGKTATTLWPPLVAGAVACFLGGICAFWMGRRLGQSGLEKIQWLHLTPKRLAWPERFFKRHGAKAVFIARFIALFPPVVANLLAGMSKMRWHIFLFFNLTGSLVYATVYILLGYFFGKKWKLLQAWLGLTLLYLILTGIVLIVLGVMLRGPLAKFWNRFFSRQGARKQT